jgi:hypothetical protein
MDDEEDEADKGDEEDNEDKEEVVDDSIINGFFFCV